VQPDNPDRAVYGQKMSDHSTPTGADQNVKPPEQLENASCKELRKNIRRLQAELADRKSQARPLPSSVMRAYQKLIDRYFLALDAETAKQDKPASS